MGFFSTKKAGGSAVETQASLYQRMKKMALHRVAYGQSLVNGLSAGLAFTTALYGTLMFDRGIQRAEYTDPDGSLYPDGPEAFVPAEETEFTVNIGGSDYNFGETGFVEAGNAYAARMAEELGASASATAFANLVSSAGVNGVLLSTLMKGNVSGRYDVWLEMVTQAKALANDIGMTYVLKAVPMSQGEGDTNSATDPDEWFADAVQMASDMVADGLANSDIAFRPIILWSQIASHLRYRQSNEDAHKQAYIALKQRDLGADASLSDVVCYAPHYFLPHADNVHLTAVGYAWRGAYLARAEVRVDAHRRAGTPGKPKIALDIASVEVSGTTIDVYYDNPDATPVEFDASGQITTTNLANKGFDIFDADQETVVDIITDVSIIADNHIRITTSSDLLSGRYLGYGLGRASGTDWGTSGPVTGPRGLVRNNAGATDTATINGVTKRMDDWALMRLVSLS